MIRTDLSTIPWGIFVFLQGLKLKYNLKPRFKFLYFIKLFFCYCQNATTKRNGLNKMGPITGRRHLKCIGRC